MRKLLIAAAVAALPSVGAAQSVSTDCYAHKSRVSCYSRVIPEPWRYPVAPRPDPKIIAEGERILAEQAARRRDPRFQDAEFQNWRVSQFLASGDCAGAQGYSAATGNAALVERVAGFCGKVAN